MMELEVSRVFITLHSQNLTLPLTMTITNSLKSLSLAPLALMEFLVVTII
ncbi:hypothetical protein IC582_009610 [Cucumis melo]